MNIRRLVLDVDRAVSRPSVVDIARAIEEFPVVHGVNVTVTEIDIETVGMEDRVSLGNPLYWSTTLVIGGVALSILGAWLRIV